MQNEHVMTKYDPFMCFLQLQIKIKPLCAPDGVPEGPRDSHVSGDSDRKPLQRQIQG